MVILNIKKLELSNVSKNFNKKNQIVHVLDKINIYLNENELVSIIGPSGCGKSTIFNLITGIDSIYDGKIFVDNRPLDEYKKPFGYMEQKDLLMPWFKLIDNLTIPLEIKGFSKSNSIEIVKSHLTDFGLDKFEHHYPKELSGGMRQRAALLRTVLLGSYILLLDEPFASVDSITKKKLQSWLLNIQNKYKRSIFFIN